MKRIILLAVFLSLPDLAQAATYYARTDGGTATQCTGLVNAAYPGSGTAQPCAWNDPFWCSGVHWGGVGDVTTSPKCSPGDTLIIDGTGGAQYKVGRGMPSNTGGGNANFPYQYYPMPFPNGIDADHPTRILGKGWDSGCTAPPQLYGTQAVGRVINIDGAKHIEIGCLEITDHAQCGSRVGSGSGQVSCPENYPADVGDWGNTGIFGIASGDVYLHDILEHGMANRGILSSHFSPQDGSTTALRVKNVRTIGNNQAGWDMDTHSYGNYNNTGTLVFDNYITEWNGCQEKYPMTGAVGDESQYSVCLDQNTNGVYADGFGIYHTDGDFVFINSQANHNASDGFDTIYHNCNGSIIFYRSRGEGNVGANFKFGALDNYFVNSTSVGNCKYLSTSGKGVGITYCRGGSNLGFQFNSGCAGQQYHTIRSTLWTDQGTNIDAGGYLQANACDGSEVMEIKDTMCYGADRADGHGTNSSCFYCSGTDGNGSGPCCTGATKIVPVYSHDVVYNTSDTPAGTAMSYSDPHVAQGDHINGEINTTYYDMSLTAGSTNAINQGDNALTVPGGNADENGFTRDETPDIGALEYLSVPSTLPDGSYCWFDDDCSGNHCCSNSCSSASCTNPALNKSVVNVKFNGVKLTY